MKARINIEGSPGGRRFVLSQTEHGKRIGIFLFVLFLVFTGCFLAMAVWLPAIYGWTRVLLIICASAEMLVCVLLLSEIGWSIVIDEAGVLLKTPLWFRKEYMIPWRFCASWGIARVDLKTTCAALYASCDADCCYPRGGHIKKQDITCYFTTKAELKALLYSGLPDFMEEMTGRQMLINQSDELWRMLP
ncbi:MAG: hypothetical protein MJ192_03380 [Clostridia bacterium]|nr:hypothetical protein [Clostridia bacterium]